MSLCVESLQSCPTLCDPMDYSPPSSSVHGIFQARMEFFVMPSSRGCSWPNDTNLHFLSLLQWQADSLTLVLPVVVQSFILVQRFAIHGLEHSRLPCSSPSPRACSNSCPLSRWYYPTISSSVICFSSCPLSLQHQGLFQWVDPLHQVAKVLKLHLQHQSFRWILRTDFL